MDFSDFNETYCLEKLINEKMNFSDSHETYCSEELITEKIDNPRNSRSEDALIDIRKSFKRYEQTNKKMSVAKAKILLKKLSKKVSKDDREFQEMVKYKDRLEAVIFDAFSNRKLSKRSTKSVYKTKKRHLISDILLLCNDNKDIENCFDDLLDKSISFNDSLLTNVNFIESDEVINHTKQENTLNTNSNEFENPKTILNDKINDLKQCIENLSLNRKDFDDDESLLSIIQSNSKCITQDASVNMKNNKKKENIEKVGEDFNVETLKRDLEMCTRKICVLSGNFYKPKVKKIDENKIKINYFEYNGPVIIKNGEKFSDDECCNKDDFNKKKNALVNLSLNFENEFKEKFKNLMLY